MVSKKFPVARNNALDKDIKPELELEPLRWNCFAHERHDDVFLIRVTRKSTAEELLKRFNVS